MHCTKGVGVTSRCSRSENLYRGCRSADTCLSTSVMGQVWPSLWRRLMRRMNEASGPYQVPTSGLSFCSHHLGRQSHRLRPNSRAAPPLLVQLPVALQPPSFLVVAMSSSTTSFMRRKMELARPMTGTHPLSPSARLDRQMSCMAMVDVMLFDPTQKAVVYTQDVPNDIAMLDLKRFPRVVWGYRCKLATAKPISLLIEQNCLKIITY